MSVNPMSLPPICSVTILVKPSMTEVWAGLAGPGVTSWGENMSPVWAPEQLTSLNLPALMVGATLLGQLLVDRKHPSGSVL